MSIILEALILQESPEPGVRDLFLLPSPLLQLSQFPSHHSDQLLSDLKMQCEAYGEISECRMAEGGHAFVHFEEVRTQAMYQPQIRALLGLTFYCVDCVAWGK